MKPRLTKKLLQYSEFIVVKLIFAIFKLIGIDAASNIAGFIARLIGPKLSINRIARINLKVAFPDISKAKQDEIIKGMWDNLGRTFGEFPHIYEISDVEFNKRVKVINQENIEMLRNGGLFFSGHIANWEVSPRVSAIRGINVSLIYRHANNQKVDQVISNERSKQNISIISKGSRDVKKILTSLKEGKTIAMLIDQKINEGRDILFFGKAAKTATSIPKLAKSFNCQIITSQVIRNQGANFTVKLTSMNLHENETAEEYMLRANKLLESWIYENPSQWFWLHRRYNKDFYR